MYSIIFLFFFCLAVSSKWSTFQVADHTITQQIPQDAEILVLSDVHIDQPKVNEFFLLFNHIHSSHCGKKKKVMEKLRRLFMEYEDHAPAMVIMMGNFSSGNSL